MLINQILGQALARVREQANLNNAQIVQSSQILRADREILLKTECLQEIIRGWYMLVHPDTATGDTAAWYTNF